MCVPAGLPNNDATSFNLLSQAAKAKTVLLNPKKQSALVTFVRCPRTCGQLPF